MALVAELGLARDLNNAGMALVAELGFARDLNTAGMALVAELGLAWNLNTAGMALGKQVCRRRCECIPMQLIALTQM